MSYCRYTTFGDYICDNIEHMKPIGKPIGTTPIQSIHPNFSNFNNCKKIINNKIYNINPNINNKCNKFESAKQLNNFLFKKTKANCNNIDPKNTLYPSAKFNINDFMNNDKYDKDNNLLSINKTICKLNNKDYILCNNSSEFKTTIQNTKIEECYNEK